MTRHADAHHITEQALNSPQQRGLQRGLNRLAALAGAGLAVVLLLGAGVAAAQGTAVPASPSPSVPAPVSATSTLPPVTGTLTDPSGTTVPKITPAPEPRG